MPNYSVADKATVIIYKRMVQTTKNYSKSIPKIQTKKIKKKHEEKGVE